MSIKIKGGNGKPSKTSLNKSGSTEKGAKSSTQSSRKTADNDRVDLTEAASRLHQIEQSLADIPVIDTGRVEAISQSIDEGTYTIDNEKIADRIIESETALRKKKDSL